MNIFEVIDRVIDVFKLSEADDERMHRVLLMSAVAVAFKTVPPPDDFEFGTNEEEIKDSVRVIEGIINENPEVREAIAEHFSGVLGSLSGGVSEEKLETLKGILDEFRDSGAGNES